MPHQLSRPTGRALSIVRALVIVTASLGASTPASGAAGDAPRVCLALSGGGARGLAHVGVLKVLEELRVPIDCIAGTSMGALVGGLYAAGYSPEEIEEQLAAVDWADMYRDRPPRRSLSFRRKDDDRRYLLDFELGVRGGRVVAPSGRITGGKLDLLLRALSLRVVTVERFDDLPVRFRAVATDLATGRRVVLDRGDLPTALRASMAIPGVFSPVSIAGRVLVDGGLVDNLPVDAAREMGADVIIAVDASTVPRLADDLQSLFSVLSQIVTLAGHEDLVNARRAADVLLQPDLTSYAAADFYEFADIVSRGEQEARRLAADLARYTASVDDFDRRQVQRAAQRPFAVRVDFVRTTGLERVDARYVRGRLRLKPGDTPDPAALNEDLSTLYGLGDFEGITYTRRHDNGRTGVELAFREKTWGPTYLQFGLNAGTDFGSDTAFTLLGNVTRRHINARGAEWRTDLFVGRTLGLVSEFYQPIDWAGRYFVAPQVSVFELGRPLFDQGHRIAQYTSRRYVIGIDGGMQFGRWAEVRLGVRLGTADARARTGAPELPGFDVRVGALVAGGVVDTLDHGVFPTSGSIAEVNLVRELSVLGAHAARADPTGTRVLEPHDRLAFRAIQFVPRGTRTFFGGLDGGSSLGTELPQIERFRLGGLLSLSGFQEGELSGHHFVSARVGMHQRVARLAPAFGRGIYVGAWLEAASVSERWQDLAARGVIVSGTVLLGADTALGPIHLACGIGEGGHRRFYLAFGRSMANSGVGSAW
jgi:NTE family protein